MKNPTQFDWFIDVNKVFGTITIKAKDEADTPICKIATPTSKDWMQNESWQSSAIKKAESIVELPQLIKKAKKLLEQIEKSEYTEPNGHNLRNNKALHDLQSLIKKLS